MPTPAIDARRLWQDLMTLGALGATPRGGSDRMALTDSDRDARNLFALWCAEAGLSLTIDAIGNMFARRDGTDPSLAPVMVGSHLDTQSPGGRFDGPLGVMAGLAAVRAMNAAGIASQRPIEVVNWTCEEGARFSRGLMGSSVYTGTLVLEDAYACVDREGRTVGAELTRIGYKGTAQRGGQAPDSYLELHIEQGPELDRSGITIGAVTHSCYSASGTVECEGENGHTSSLPMLDRRNALVGAARVIAAIDDIGRAWASEGSATVPTIQCWPNNRINIPHRASVHYGLVHPTADGIAAMQAEVDAALARISDETGLPIRQTDHRERAPVHFDGSLTQQVEQLAMSAGYSVQRMPTRPGHDAFNMIPLCPTQLIFVPCRKGISHSELEWCAPEHCEAGANVLLQMMIVRAR